jgi:hypothetical protein
MPLMPELSPVSALRAVEGPEAARRNDRLHERWCWTSGRVMHIIRSHGTDRRILYECSG